MKTWLDVIEAFEGPAELGRALGIPTEHAVQMKRRRSIPARHWPALTKAATKRGIELSPGLLTRLATRRQIEGRPSQGERPTA